MKTLKNEGHTTDEAEDGQLAVEKVKDKGLTTFDSILMDFVMVRLVFKVFDFFLFLSPLSHSLPYTFVLMLHSFLGYLAGNGWTKCYQSHPRIRV